MFTCCLSAQNAKDKYASWSGIKLLAQPWHLGWATSEKLKGSSQLWCNCQYQSSLPSDFKHFQHISIQDGRTPRSCFYCPGRYPRYAFYKSLLFMFKAHTWFSVSSASALAVKRSSLSNLMSRQLDYYTYTVPLACNAICAPAITKNDVNLSPKLFLCLLQ